MAEHSSLPVGATDHALETLKITRVDNEQVHREGVFLGGHESAGNTSTTALGSAETFTGTGELFYDPDVMVSCQTDNDGTLYFDFSVDGTNWSTFPVNGFAVASGTHEFHTAVKGPRNSIGIVLGVAQRRRLIAGIANDQSNTILAIQCVSINQNRRASRIEQRNQDRENTENTGRY